MIAKPITRFAIRSFDGPLTDATQKNARRQNRQKGGEGVSSVLSVRHLSILEDFRPGGGDRQINRADQRGNLGEAIHDRAAPEIRQPLPGPDGPWCATLPVSVTTAN